MAFALARGSDLQGTDPRKPAPDVKKVQPADKPEASCGNHNTAVYFVDSPKTAAAQAKKEEKLVFVLHVSGLFEDPTLT
jgi:hypothetical protein